MRIRLSDLKILTSTVTSFWKSCHWSIFRFQSSVSVFNTIFCSTDTHRNLDSSHKWKGRDGIERDWTIADIGRKKRFSLTRPPMVGGRSSSIIAVGEKSRTITPHGPVMICADPIRKEPRSRRRTRRARRTGRRTEKRKSSHERRMPGIPWWCECPLARTVTERRRRRRSIWNGTSQTEKEGKREKEREATSVGNTRGPLVGSITRRAFSAVSPGEDVQNTWQPPQNVDIALDEDHAIWTKSWCAVKQGTSIKVWPPRPDTRSRNQREN